MRLPVPVSVSSEPQPVPLRIVTPAPIVSTPSDTCTRLRNRPCTVPLKTTSPVPSSNWSPVNNKFTSALSTLSRETVPFTVSPFTTVTVLLFGIVRTPSIVTPSSVRLAPAMKAAPPSPGKTVALRNVPPLAVNVLSTWIVVVTSSVPPDSVKASVLNKLLICVSPLAWVIVTSSGTSITTSVSGPGNSPFSQLAGSFQSPPAGLIQVERPINGVGSRPSGIPSPSVSGLFLSVPTRRS